MNPGGTQKPLRKMLSAEWRAAGVMYDGRSSAGVAAELRIEDQARMRVRFGTGEMTFDLGDCHVAPPLGTTMRVVTFPTGARFETRDLAAMRELDEALASGRGLRWVHRLESHWRHAALALAVLALLCVALYRWGIPVAARHIAFALPQPVLQSASDQVLAVFERLGRLDPSALSQERQLEIQSAFRELVTAAPGDYTYSLRLVNSEEIGPNAFALPSGQIVMTDQLVKLAKDDREIIAVLAHELTHVTRRHGMRMVLQNSGLFIVLAALLGDLTSVTSLAASLPTVLAQSQYSRQFEMEADAGAAAHCLKAGWGTQPLRDILIRMTGDGLSLTGESLLATHPELQRRLRLLLEFEKRPGRNPAQNP